MVRLFVFLAAAELVLLVLALISALSVDQVRNLPRFLWVLVIFVIPLLGPIAYFLAGRPSAAPREGTPRRSAPPPASPDDDPDFLGRVDTEQSRRDRELLAQWERELQNGDDEK
jgi:phospholipase D-like protein